MNLKHGFSKFFEADPDRLHFSAHSHHPWPDVTLEAHKKAWEDAASMADDKWDYVFGELMPATRALIADTIGLHSGDTLTFGPNTHGFLTRIFSCLEPPVRILSTDAEFHSFSRQARRWEEEGLAVVDRVSGEPFETFTDRFTREARAGVHDLIYLSQVFFDSGFVIEDLDRIVASVSEERAFIVIDGYHSFMARPVNIGAIQDRAFFVAGGYKYAMSGEGVCFLHSPPGYGERPVDTGWYAGFSRLESGTSDIVTYRDDGSRFAGATFDVSGIYRMRAVLDWLRSQSVTPGDISSHVSDLQGRFLGSDPSPGELMPAKTAPRGNFLTFKTADAKKLYTDLHHRGIITDYRYDRLRVGFGVYHDESDVDRLIEVFEAIL